MRIGTSKGSGTKSQDVGPGPSSHFTAVPYPPCDCSEILIPVSVCAMVYNVRCMNFSLFCLMLCSWYLQQYMAHRRFQLYLLRKWLNVSHWESGIIESASGKLSQRLHWVNEYISKVQVFKQTNQPALSVESVFLQTDQGLWHHLNHHSLSIPRSHRGGRYLVTWPIWEGS
jgi:hypothetical protein